MLFEGGAVGDIGRVRHRIGNDIVGAMLGDKQLSPSVRSLAARDPDPWVRRVLTHNDKVLTATDLAELVKQPDPIVDRIMYAHSEAPAWLRRAVLTPGRYPQTPHPLAELHAELLATTVEPDLPRYLGAAVVSDVPELVAHALRVCAGTLTAAEELRGLLSLSRHGGTALIPDALPHVRPEVAAAAGRLAEVAAAHEILAAAVVEAEGAAGLVAELRAGLPPRSWRQDIDWDALLTAHRADPLPEETAARLAADPACPDELLVALYAAHPAAVGPVARPTVLLLRAALTTPKHPGLARIATATRDMAEPADIARIPYEVAPARTAVATLAELPDCPALRELLHRHLGTHADRWATLRIVLPRHRDPLPALLAGIEAGTVTAPPEQPGGPPPTLTKPYRHLLVTADPDDLRELLPRLPDALVRDLLSSGTLPPHVHEAAITSTDPRAWEAVARNVGLDIRDLARLVAKEVPAVDAAAYLSMRATPSLRRTIARRAPLDPALRAEVLAHGDRRTLLPLVVSGEPELAARALGFGCRKVAQQYAYIKVWERHGPDGVRDLLERAGTNTAAPIRTRVQSALKAADGLADLRASGEAYDDPETLPELFQTRTSRTTVRDLVHEPYAHDFPRLMAANREEPFASEAIDDLIRHEDATDEDRAALRLVMVNACRGWDRKAVDIEPAEWLRTDRYVNADAWVNAAVEHGLLDPALLVDVAYPAQPVVLSARHLAPDAVLAPMRARLAELTRDHLAGHSEAFAIAVGMIDGFAASLADLVTVAAQAAGPRPDAEVLARDDAATLAAAQRAASETANVEPVAKPAPVTRNTARKMVDPDKTAKVSAVHLLRTIAADPEGQAHVPVPEQPAVLASLVDMWVGHAPDFEYPGWLYEACFASESVEPRAALGRRVFDEAVANDLIDLGEPEVLAALTKNKDLEEPTAARVAAILAGTPTERPEQYPSSNTWPQPSTASSYLRWVREYYDETRGGGDGLAVAAYRQGIVGPAELIGVLPAGVLTPLPRKWQARVVAGPIYRAVDALVADRLGTDPDRWLRALTAMGTSIADRPLPELLALDPESLDGIDIEWQHVASPVTFDAHTVRTSRARPPHGWWWPAGRLLLHASPEALAVVLPELGPDAFATLWSHARHTEYVSAALNEYPFLANDREALRILATRSTNSQVRDRILRFDDPVLNADLYGNVVLRTNTEQRRAILSRVPQGRPASGPEDLLPLDPGLREQLLHEYRPSSASLPALRLKVEAADPQIIEHGLRQLAKKLSMLDQLLAVRGLLRYGGADRIGGLVEEGVLGAAAGKLVVKALASADPEAALTERIDRELTGDKLVARLRRCPGGAETDEVLDLPYLRDWDLIVAEQAREAFPRYVLNQLVGLPDAPARLLETDSMLPYRSARKAGRLSAAHARASIANGSGVMGDSAWYTHLDQLVEDGLVTGHDLVHTARGAAPILRYIAEALIRIDVPAPIRTAGTEAKAEIAHLIETHLGHDQAKWNPVFAALTGTDNTWPQETPGSTIAALLTR